MVDWVVEKSKNLVTHWKNEEPMGMAYCTFEDMIAQALREAYEQGRKDEREEVAEFVNRYYGSAQLATSIRERTPDTQISKETK